MEVPVRRDDLEPRAQPQVERIPEHDLRAELLELRRAHRLHGAVGADGHERRRIDLAVREREPPAARGPVVRDDAEPGHSGRPERGRDPESIFISSAADRSFRRTAALRCACAIR